MKRYLYFVLFFLPTILCAHVPEGVLLTKQLWKDLQEKNIKQLNVYTSGSFQFTELGSQLNKSQTLAFVQNLDILSYHLSAMKVTKKHHLLIVTYIATAREKFASSTFTRNGNRITVWKKTDGKWQWVAQADTSPTVPVQ